MCLFRRGVPKMMVRQDRQTRRPPLVQAEAPEKYYIEVIMQEKIKLYLEYVEKHNFWYDSGLIFKTFWVIVKER